MGNIYITFCINNQPRHNCQQWWNLHCSSDAIYCLILGIFIHIPRLVEAWCREQIFKDLLNSPCPDLHKLNVRVDYHLWIFLSSLDDNLLICDCHPPLWISHTHTHTPATRDVVTDKSKYTFQPYFWKDQWQRQTVLVSGEQFCTNIIQGRNSLLKHQCSSKQQPL